MNSKESHHAYGDSHTLDRPGSGEAVHPYGADLSSGHAHPLDSSEVVEKADRQGWGS